MNYMVTEEGKIR